MSRPSPSSSLYTSSAVRWRTFDVSNRLMILRRGTVALRPALFRSWLMSIPPRTRFRMDHRRYNRSFALMVPTVLRSFSRAAPRMVVAAALVALAGGCATADRYVPSWRSFGVYRIDINQGNYLSQDTVDKLKVGMTQAQVRQVLGTPLVTSPFRTDRWDYVYEYSHQGRVVEH